MHRQGTPAPGGAWSVHIDPQRRLVRCGTPSCTFVSGVHYGSRALREAVLSHLACHVRGEQLPGYLRTCSCRSIGCAWHGRSRGCGGDIALVLFRRGGGRAWHLAYVCEACAHSIPQAARITAEVLDGRSPAAAGYAPRQPRGGRDARSQQRLLAVRAALSYTSASLDAGVSGEARLLAVACALRVRRSGFAALPNGFVKALHLARPAGSIGELQEAGWLHYYGRPRGGPAVFLPELAGQPTSRQAGHLVFQVLAHRAVRVLRPETQLAAVTVAAWREEQHATFLVEPEGAARCCGLSARGLLEALDEVCAAGLLTSWQMMPSGLLLCAP